MGLSVSLDKPSEVFRHVKCLKILGCVFTFASVVTLLLQESFHLIPLLLQESSLHLSFVKTFFGLLVSVTF